MKCLVTYVDEKGVIPIIIHDYAINLGMQEQQIIHASNTISGTQKALEWAKEGDLLLILGLTNRDEIIKLLTQVSQSG